MKIGIWEVSKPGYLPDFDQLSESSQPLSRPPKKIYFSLFCLQFCAGRGRSEMNNKIDALSEKPEIELDPTHVHQLLCNLPADSLKLFQEVEAF